MAGRREIPAKIHRRGKSVPIPVHLLSEPIADEVQPPQATRPRDLFATTGERRDDGTTHSPYMTTPVPSTIVLVDDEISSIPDPIVKALSFDLKHPAKWAITFDQLLDVHEEAGRKYGNRYGKKTMRDINEDIIKKQCQLTHKSYALSVNPIGRKVGAFITHCWDENFRDFVSSIQAAFHHFPIKPNLWICAFALIQGDFNIVRESMMMPLIDSPFIRALEEATWFVVVRNSKRDLYSRLWCVCELLFAKQFGFTTGKDGEDDTSIKHSTMVIGPDVFSKLTTSCIHAKATDEDDARRILELLETEHTVEEVDALVKQYRKHEILPPDQSTRLVKVVILSLVVVGIAVAIILPLLRADPRQAPTLESNSIPRKAPTLEPISVPSPTMPPGKFLESLPNYTIEALKDEFSPQSEAKEWALAHPAYALKEEWQQSQLFALATLYYSYNGDKWFDRKKADWLSLDVPECSWPGEYGASIVCNKDNRVTKIRLDEQGDVSGGNPPELSLLASLETLEISRMDLLHRPLDQLLPFQLSNLRNLTNLIISYNSITGSLPSLLGEFQTLTNLKLRDNQFTGDIPTEIGLMTRLEHLRLDDNQISGRVPSEFGFLSSLKSLQIQDNNIVGELPEEICMLSNLTFVQVDRSTITCPPGCKGHSSLCPTMSPTTDLLLEPTERPSKEMLPDYDPGSPQYKALDWLANDTRYLYEDLEQWRKDQLFAMASFYYSYAGDNWPETQRQSWLSQIPECSWGIEGVAGNKCNDEDRITRLALVSQTENITGTTPPELSLLSSLEDLEISRMELYTNLTEVMPRKLATLQNLTHTTFESAHLRGSLPAYLGAFQGLTTLNLGNNMITGQIATELGLLGRLQNLFLDGNLLSRGVPTELGALSSLVTLYLHDNDLSGPLPVDICFLPSLQLLTVDCRKVECPIECDCECRDPDDVDSSPAPTSSPTKVNNLSLAEELGLTPYPTSWPNSYALDLPKYSVEALGNSTSAQSIAYAWLVDHPVISSMPEWKKQQLFALVTFYHAFAGERWSGYETTQNWLNYTVDECMWNSAETADICDQNGRILELSIQSAQGFNGSALPQEIGLLSSLRALKLFLLKDFRADLSELLPMQLAYLPLDTLFLFDTQVYGTIPSQLGDFRRLTSLDLRSNAMTGTLPSELGLLTHLRSLNLYGNAFSGQIPSDLGRLTLMESLLLDRTEVAGTVPEEVCSLSSLSLIRVNCSLVVNCSACEPCSCYTELN